MGFSLTNLLGGSLGEAFSKIVGTFKLSPEKKAELEVLLESHKFELATKQAELESKLADFQAREVEAAHASIQTEAKSDDRFTRRWRPAFGYMCTALIFWNYAIVPIFKQIPVQLPDALFQLFAAYLLMAVGSRTWEKITSIKNGTNANGS